MGHEMKLRILISLSICILLLIACEGESEKRRKEQIERNKDAENTAAVYEINYRQSAILLSLKYDLPEEDVFKILIDYDSGWSMLERIEKRDDSLFVPMNKNEIIECAKKFNTSPKMIATLIVDFEAMKQKEK